MLLYEIIEALAEKKIKFAIVGGYALALHGITRATIDVDIVLSLSLSEYEAAEKALQSIQLQSRIPVRAKDIIMMREEYIKNRNLIAWSFVDYKDPTRQLDILITKDVRDLQIEKVSVGKYKIPVVSLEDLLKMKLESGRPQDLVDVTNIKEKLNEKKNRKK